MINFEVDYNYTECLARFMNLSARLSSWNHNSSKPLCSRHLINWICSWVKKKELSIPLIMFKTDHKKGLIYLSFTLLWIYTLKSDRTADITFIRDWIPMLSRMWRLIFWPHKLKPELYINLFLFYNIVNYSTSYSIWESCTIALKSFSLPVNEIKEYLQCNKALYKEVLKEKKIDG